MHKHQPLVSDVLFSQYVAKLHMGVMKLERQRNALVTPALNEIERLTGNRKGRYWRDDCDSLKDSWVIGKR